MATLDDPAAAAPVAAQKQQPSVAEEVAAEAEEAAVPPEVTRLDTETQDILRARIAKNTRGIYLRMNVRFIRRKSCRFGCPKPMKRIGGGKQSQVLRRNAGMLVRQ